MSEQDVEVEFGAMMDDLIPRLIALGVIMDNSYGVVVGEEVDETFIEVMSWSMDGENNPKHDGRWYLENASGKGVLCAMSKMNSAAAIALYPLVACVQDGMFPWGGGIYSSVTKAIVATSGGTELEDVFVSSLVMAWIELEFNKEGKRVLDAARERGDAADEEIAADRFTRW